MEQGETTKEEKEKRIKHLEKKYLDKNSVRNGIFSIIASIIHGIGLGSFFVFGNFSTYLISYLRHFEPEGQKSLTLKHTYFISPIFQIVMGIFIPISGVIEFKIGIKRSIILGAIIQTMGCSIFYFSHNYYLDLLGFFISAIGCSISLVLTSKNAVMYFFNKKGTISGILSLITTLNFSVFNAIGEKVIINPKSVGPDNESFYPYEVSKNIVNYTLFQIAMIGITSLLCILFIVPYDMKASKKLNDKIQEDKKENESKRKENIEERLLPGEGNENEDAAKTPLSWDNKEENIKINDEKQAENEDKDTKNIDIQEDLKEKLPTEIENEVFNSVALNDSTVNMPQRKYSTAHIKKAIKNFRVWRFFIMSILSSPLSNFMMMTWRPIAIYKKLDTNAIQDVNTYSSIISSIATPLFGFLSDKVSFRILKVSLMVVSAIIGFFFYSSFNNITTFTIQFLVSRFVSSAGFQISGPHFMKVFGMQYYIEISGIIGIAEVIMSPICSFSVFFIESFKSSIDSVYIFLFSAGAVLTTIAGILALFETEEKMKY